MLKFIWIGMAALNQSENMQKKVCRSIPQYLELKVRISDQHIHEPLAQILAILMLFKYCLFHSFAAAAEQKTLLNW